ncbi:S9 family peptidase [Wenzhouxiangella sp. AB-CW3]|nr:S9 family peptidase [Wenzhouxiangella sp. AB-CW3]
MLAFSPAVQAEQADSLAYLDQLPELIDRDLFFGDPEISGAQLSPDGQYVTFMRPYEGVRNIWIKEQGQSFDDARPLTADSRPVPGYFWTHDSGYVLYVQDRDGDENFHVWAVDPQGEPDDNGVPAARNLTDGEDVRAQIISVPRSNPDRLVVGINDRDPALHDVYAVSIATGERELLIENVDNVAGWSADLEGNIRLATRQTDAGGTEVMRVADGELGDVLFECSWQETCGPAGFLPDGDRVWFQSNRGEDIDLVGLYILDLESGDTELFERDPEGEVDFGGVILSPATDELLATVYVGDRPRIYPHDENFEADLEFLRENLPEGEIGISSMTADERLALVSLSRDVDPGTVYLFDREQRTVEKFYRSRPEIDPDQMSEMKPIRYTARDGLEIPAYLTIPRGADPENLAVVALIHGGPWARDTWGYRSQVQFLANRGYAVLQPNFRGSAGFGKTFLNAGNNEWGDAMQDDITDGIKHLIEEGIADPDRVCIMGGSYGGYATLAGMVFTPELYACGVNIVGVSNIITLLNSIPPYWGPIREMFIRRVGDPDTEEGRKQLERQSPINHVEQIASPLLVIHGANDPRVRQAEADQIVVAMRESDLPVEYIVAPDEGHGFRGLENRMAMFARTEEFLASHLGGRYQPDMAEDIAVQLAAITVDVDEVELPDLADELAAARTRPLPTVNAEQILDGRLEYVTRLSVQGNELEVPATRTIERTEQDGRTVIEVRSESSSPMGEASDRIVVDGRTLRPIKRRAEQGPATIKVDFDSRQISGEIDAGAQQIPIDIELDAPVFGGETALELVISALPLTQDYRRPLRFAEIGMQQQVRYFNLTVTDRESIDVPAGEFEAWRIELSALDDEGGDQVIWRKADAPYQVLRVQGQLPPQMGGGEFTTELTATD